MSYKGKRSFLNVSSNSELEILSYFPDDGSILNNKLEILSNFSDDGSIFPTASRKSIKKLKENFMVHFTFFRAREIGIFSFRALFYIGQCRNTPQNTWLC